MKPSVEQLATLCPDCSEDLVRHHLDRLGPDYFQRFSEAQIAEHLTALAQLCDDHPVQCLITQGDGRDVVITILGYDHPFVFSLITGLLSGTGVSIREGDIFTYGEASDGKDEAANEGKSVTSGSSLGKDIRGRSRGSFTRRRNFRRNVALARRGFSSVSIDPLKRKRIIDHFEGKLARGVSFEQWSTLFEERLEEIMLMLMHTGKDPERAQAIKARISHLVVDRLGRLKATEGIDLPPVNVQLGTDKEPNANIKQTRLHISSRDTPAFLYSLSTALSLLGLSIERVRIHSEGDQVDDELFVVDAHGKPITDPAEQERIRFTAVLTKQFTYFLDRAPDPFTALSRFEELAYEVLNQPAEAAEPWSKLIDNPRAMEYLARLLGASDFLWEDFIRFQYESLDPLFLPRGDDEPFCEPSETLPQRLDAALKDAVGLAEQIDQLNKFKDRELFLIDLDHILRPESDFRILSHRLTDLAEALITRVTQLVYNDLVRSYGEPRTEDGQLADYAIFGLGKLGGYALGYASDLELLFVYRDAGHTTGGKRKKTNNAEFYELMVRDLSRAIRTRHEGIYTIDLRLRPHGNDGPLACTVDQYERYYSKGGGAHAFEQLAMVRLRHIGGARDLGERVRTIRNRIVYETHQIDIPALWEMWAAHHDQKLTPGVLNAKHSPGALVDLEGAIQLLQAKYGGEHERLRTSRIGKALRTLADEGIVSPQERDELTDAYYFFRRLINAMRMLRGSAIDLNLPPIDSNDYLHLARRMEYPDDGALSAAQQLDLDFQTQAAMIRAFVERQFGRDYVYQPEALSVPDAVLAESMSNADRGRPFVALGFRYPEDTAGSLRQIVPDHDRAVYAKVIALACTFVRDSHAPDVALQHYVQLVQNADEGSAHFELMLKYPVVLKTILAILETFDPLAEELIVQPKTVTWLVEWMLEHVEDSPETLRGALWRKLLRKK